MILKGMATSAKLLWLAKLIEGSLSKQFRQDDSDECIVGLGARVRGDGTLGRMRDGGDKELFIKRFGVTAEEVEHLYWARFDRFDRRLKGFGGDLLSDVKPRHAAAGLRALARRYARKGE